MVKIVVAGTTFSTPDYLCSDLFNFEHKKQIICEPYIS